MKILHVVAGLPRAGGGLSELVPAFARQAAARGHDVCLATVAGAGEALSDAALAAEKEGVKLIRFAPTPPRRLFFSLEMLRTLRTYVAAADVVHVHSNWTFPVWWGCHLALALRKKLVMSPQGCVEPERLKRSAWKKRAAGLLFDRRYLRRAAAVHATCAAEAAGIERYLGRPATQPLVAVIPNGVDGGLFSVPADRKAFERKWPECQGKRAALFLSRIHPLKGLDLLASAWAQVAGSFPGWHLLIAGPAEEGCLEQLKGAVKAQGLSARVSICGPLYGADKALALKSASLFVLPTRNENFGIAVAEALACGVPVITTKGAPWQELEGSSCHSALVNECVSSLVGDDQRLENGSQKFEVGGRKSEVLGINEPMNARTNQLARTGRAGWWVDIGVEPLAQALREAMALTDEDLRAMGENGRRLAQRKCRWEGVGEQMERVYQSLFQN